MSKEYEKPLTLELTRSPVLHKYVVGIYCLSVFSVLYASLNLVIQIALLALLGLMYRHQQQHDAHRLVKIIWLQENNWVVLDNAGNAAEVQLTPMSFLSSWLVVLAFKDERGKRINLVVPYDAVEVDTFRCLKLRLTILKTKYLRSLS